jgi:hypothetical protein
MRPPQTPPMEGLKRFKVLNWLLICEDFGKSSLPVGAKYWWAYESKFFIETHKDSILLIDEPNDEVCDARDDDSSTTAG